MEIFLSVLLIAIIVILAKCVRVMPQRQAYIVERLGKYYGTLEAGFHILMPVIDRVAYRHTLKEQAIDVPP